MSTVDYLDEFSTVAKCFFHISVTSSSPVSPPTVDGRHNFLLLFLILCQDIWESVPVMFCHCILVMIFPEISTGSQCIFEFFSILFHTDKLVCTFLSMLIYLVTCMQVGMSGNFMLFPQPCSTQCCYVCVECYQSWFHLLPV